MNYHEKEFVSGKEKIKEVEKLIKSKILKKSPREPHGPQMQMTYVRQEKVQIPYLLELFLTTLLSNEIANK